MSVNAFVLLSAEHLKLRKQLNAESDDVEYPSPLLKQLWANEAELNKAFNNAVKSTIKGD